MSENNIKIAGEDEYLSFMTDEAEPYLAERRTVQRLESVFVPDARHKNESPDDSPKNIYCEFYDCDNPHGIVLISHGFTETADKFREVIWQFLQGGFHVAIPEHCGHGRSYRLIDGDPSLVHVDRYERYVSDLRLVAKAATSRWSGLPLVLYAHSMGGGVGAALAATEPDLFEKIILTSPMIRPLTGPIPWSAAKVADRLLCAAGKEKEYVMGQPHFNENETFEDSVATSRARFEWYSQMRRSNPLFQMTSPSYAWLREAARLNRYLMSEAANAISRPVILFQAELENIVSKDEQERFIKKIKAQGGRTAPVEFVRIADAKHEIYRSGRDALVKYWDKIWEFLEK
ncbi:MAG: alpha/beta hydrolase [Clostridiales bacterium]|nr:alpha/beta hydrolase [Clostridiales bacterium]